MDVIIYKLPISVKAKYILYVLNERYGNEPFKETHDVIMKITNSSRSTLFKCLNELKEIGLIEVQRGVGPSPNTYQLKL